jgi:hypothetical protein
MTTLETQRQAYLMGFNSGAKREWIKVEKCLPSNNETVIGFLINGEHRAVFPIMFSVDPVVTGGKCEPTWLIGEHKVKGTVTHWMPLPEPPMIEG